MFTVFHIMCYHLQNQVATSLEEASAFFFLFLQLAFIILSQQICLYTSATFFSFFFSSQTEKYTYDNKPLLGHIFQVQKKNKMQKMVSSKLMFEKKKRNINCRTSSTKDLNESTNSLFLLYEERVSLVSGKKLCIYTKVNQNLLLTIQGHEHPVCRQRNK